MLWPCTGDSREWFVSQMGTDNPECGTTLHTACRRLDIAAHSAHLGDVLRIDPASSPYRLPCSHAASADEQGFALQSLTITSLNVSDRPTISCGAAAADATARCALRLHNVTMIGVDLEVDDCHVTVFSSHLIESTIYTTRTCRSLRMRMKRTNWTFSGHLPCSRMTSQSNVTDACRQTLINRLSCSSIDVTLDRVRLVLGSLVIYSRYSTHIYVVDSQFTGDPDNPKSQFLGGLRLTFSAIGANITVINCVFSNQASYSFLWSCHTATFISPQDRMWGPLLYPHNLILCAHVLI